MEIFMADLIVNKRNVVAIFGADELFVQSLCIVDSVHSKYLSATLTVRVHCSLLEKYFLQNRFKLRMYSVQNGTITDKTEFELDMLIIQDSMTLRDKTENRDHKDAKVYEELATIYFEAIPVVGSEVCYSTVNYATCEYLTAIDIVKRTLQTSNIKLDISEIDDRATTLQKYTNICIPPLRVIQAIQYINSYYAIYNGPMFVHASSTKRKLEMWNLKKSYDDKPAYHIFHLSNMYSTEDSLNNIKKIIKDRMKGSVVCFTSSPLQMSQSDNGNIIRSGYQYISINHPSDTLFAPIVENVDEMLKYLGTNENSGGLVNYDGSVKNIVTYDIKKSSDSMKTSVINSVGAYKYLAKKVIKVKLPMSYYEISKLLCVGKCVNLVTYTSDSNQHEEKFLLSNIIFNDNYNNGNVSQSVELDLYSTN